MVSTVPNRFQTVTIGPESKKASIRKNKEKKYKQAYTDVLLEEHLLAYYKSTGKVTPCSYWSKNCQGIIPRKTFSRKIQESGVKALRGLTPKPPDQDALDKIREYMGSSNSNKHSRTSKASTSNRFLTDNEELAIVQLVRLLGNMGGGITTAEFMDLIDEYTQMDMDDRERQPCSEAVVRLILKKYEDLVKIVDAGSLDPARARKATEETRDVMFFKLNCFIRSLHEMRLVPWKSFSDVPATDKFNMTLQNTVLKLLRTRYLKLANSR
jgi:hypothetical protein